LLSLDPKANPRDTRDISLVKYLHRNVLIVDAIFTLKNRLRDLEFLPQLKIYSSINFGLGTDSLIFFTIKILFRRSHPGHEQNSLLASPIKHASLASCGTWIRTKIHGSRNRSPTIRRSRNIHTIP
jgi:hypothetical protein